MARQQPTLRGRLFRMVEQALLLALLSAPMLVGAAYGTGAAPEAGPVQPLASVSGHAATPSGP
jgi:hypothetical protein